MLNGMRMALKPSACNWKAYVSMRKADDDLVNLASRGKHRQVYNASNIPSSAEMTVDLGSTGMQVMLLLSSWLKKCCTGGPGAEQTLMRLAMVTTSRVSVSGPNQMPSGAVFWSCRQHQSATVKPDFVS